MRSRVAGPGFREFRQFGDEFVIHEVQFKGLTVLLVKVTDAVEIWALSAEAFGTFVANIPAPMAIGTLTLADGRAMKGVVVEPIATEGAREISSFGGWRTFMAG